MFSLKSIRGKLTAIFVLLFSFSLITLSALGYRVHINTENEDFDIELFRQGANLASLVSGALMNSATLPGMLPTQDFEKIRSKLPHSESRSYIQIRRGNGEIFSHSEHLDMGNIPLPAEDLKTVFTEGFQFSTIDGDRIHPSNGPTPYRVLNLLIRPPHSILTPKQSGPTFADPVILQVAAPLSFVQHSRSELLSYLFIALPICLIAGGLWIAFFAGRVLAPIQTMIRAADRIEVENLNARIPLPENDREMKDLAVTLNRLLGRIEQAVKANESFVANASHQLKTPIAILRGELDILLRKPRSTEEMQAFMESAQQELQNLSTMMEDLLLLARVDSGHGNIDLSPTRLDEIAIEVVSRIDPLARKKNINLRITLAEETDGEFETLGDKELLATMLSNLVVNSINYSPPNSTVEVEVSKKNNQLLLVVKDHGVGISAEKAARLFERFYRDPFIQRKTKGSGLGLPIVKTIVDAHRGVVKYETTPGGGATFTIFLPATDLH